LTALLSTLARMDVATLQSTPLYERVVRDLGETTVAYETWWARTATHHRWRRERPDQTWHIDFETCEVTSNDHSASHAGRDD
jgi:CXXX repeat modification system protein